VVITLEYVKTVLKDLTGSYECRTRKQIFKAFGISVSKLEYDDKVGLLKRGNPHGQPRYSATDIHAYLIKIQYYQSSATQGSVPSSRPNHAIAA
jgi:hypothetical protein